MSTCVQSASQTEEDAEVKSRLEEDVEAKSRTEEDVKVKSFTNLPKVEEVECTGGLCSRYGLAFGTCILNHFPADKLVIEDIMRECHYVDSRDSDVLSNG